jgi:DNA-binding transcriptional regulator YdaS (Cro superfamily)
MKLAQRDVYIMRCGDSGPVKVGISADTNKRAVGLTQSGPSVVHVIHRVPFERKHARLVERVTHALLREYRTRGEWFDVSPSAAMRAVQEAIETIEEGRHGPLLNGEGAALDLSGELLARRLQNLGIGQTELARWLDVSDRTIRHYISGKRQVPPALALIMEYLTARPEAKQWFIDDEAQRREAKKSGKAVA